MDNLEEMDKFLEKYYFPKLNQEEMENLNRPIISPKIQTVMRNLPANKSPCLTLATPWTVDHQAPLSMGFTRQYYWSGLSFLSPGDLPNPGMEPESPALQAGSLLTEL